MALNGTIACIALACLVVFQLAAVGYGKGGGRGSGSRRPRAFSCDYYSDGTRTCRYDDDTSGSSIDGVWENEDGIFTGYLNKNMPKIKIGSCNFGVEGSAGCQGMPTTTIDSLGRMSGKGGGVFVISHYTGSIRGRIRVGAKVGGPAKDE
ncbi:uncharacterized protein LOC129596564 [Paramacrobiotus metropolitanus]|uniref:uncharacterized protein LOC129596564 n=1 Tax=Paramacrobiotus metropolitanus TaxID=2943436 RepID=UPI0024458C21|nr:uncharacterized protein LOC129596564 [Paramacrobiotus metropolitanus]